VKPLPTEGPAVTEDNRAICNVKQIPVLDADAGARDEPFAALTPNRLGWYYDDFSRAIQTDCQIDKQRIAFLLGPSPEPGLPPEQNPPDSVRVKLQCLTETQSVMASRGAGKAIGDACEVTDSGPDGCGDKKLICHPQQRVCVQTCTSSAVCPAGWVCDKRDQTVQGTRGRKGSGQPICVNPTCGP